MSKKSYTISLVIFLLAFYTKVLFSQDTVETTNPIFSGYIDAYGAYYTDSVGVSNFQKFPTVSPRSEEIGLNIAMITGKYSTDRIRGVLTLQYGDIPKSSWSETYNFIQEANAGFRISRGLWLDGGFFRSYIGCEGLLPKENITSSIAIPTFYEPYYEAGFRLSFTPEERLALNLFLLNGYNLYEDNNFKKSGGFLGTYTFNDNVSLSYANYFGDDSPEGDSVSHFRFFNNLYTNFQKGKTKFVAEFDFAFQENSKLSNLSEAAWMESGLFALSYQAGKQINVYGRAEVYNDPDGILSGVFEVQNNDTTGLKLWGITLGVQYNPTENSYIRLEGRSLTTASDQKIFRWNDENKNNRLECMINMGVSFP
ncbi:MAG: outer membrane beta-barrel protein [Ignavibacteriae bacterium]|nr:outer membrane beta-barrel protein [Ignavibacteriota bacterium]